MAVDWHATLSQLTLDDIFHASCRNGASLICLIESMTDDSIYARTVTSQIKAQFDLRTGRGVGDSAPCAVDSVEAMPATVRTVILGLDRKHRLETDITKHALTPDEIEALLFLGPFYAEHPIATDL